MNFLTLFHETDYLTRHGAGVDKGLPGELLEECCVGGRERVVALLVGLLDVPVGLVRRPVLDAGLVRAACVEAIDDRGHRAEK